MSPDEVSENEVGDNSRVRVISLPCDERHYRRFLRKVLPGPEREKGSHHCDECGEYFELLMEGHVPQLPVAEYTI